MNNDTLGLFLLIDRLLQRDRPLGRGTILPLAEIKLPEVARNFDQLIDDLFLRQLAVGDAQAFRLTPLGLDLVQETAAQHSLNALFYNEYYQAVLHGLAHAAFCERVYGKDLCQHGTADMEQIQLLLDALQVQAGMRVVETALRHPRPVPPKPGALAHEAAGAAGAGT